MSSTKRISPTTAGFAALVDAARVARRHSYSPYSSFRVGAAVRLANGEVYTGTNVENASYGLAICAERAAIFAAVAARGPRITLNAVALSCQGASRSTSFDGATLMPCGACRQVIAEFATDQTRIIVDGVGEFGMAELLPQAFALKRRR
jgi:cytidine deaminase